MARLQTISAALLAFLGVSTAESTERSDFLRDLYNGKISKSQVELVLAQHNEDIAWSDPLKSVRTVYCKGSNCGTDSIVLPNVGREGQTFLHHIVENYDRLSDWTVFSQAEAPSEGYFGHKKGGGHMLSGSRIDDYLAHHHETGGKDDAFFLMSSKVHLGSLRHALRTSFKVSDGAAAPQISEASAICPKDEGSKETEDVWGNYLNVPMLKSFLEKKCAVEADALSAMMTAFWEDFVQLPVPENEVVYYAQGARFAVSRERLQQRSKAYYQALLDGVSSDVDPCLNYLYEMSWYYMAGKPTSSPCSGNDEDVAVADDSQARFLQTGVSGVSGVSGELVTSITSTTSTSTTTTEALYLTIGVTFNSMDIFESATLPTSPSNAEVNDMLMAGFGVVDGWSGKRIESLSVENTEGRRLATERVGIVTYWYEVTDVNCTLECAADQINADFLSAVNTFAEQSTYLTDLRATGITQIGDLDQVLDYTDSAPAGGCDFLAGLMIAMALLATAART